MKIGIFADSHYSSQEITCDVRYNSRSLIKIEEAYHYFKAEKCGLVIFLGDLIDDEDSHAEEIENLKQVVDVMKTSNIPTICVMGNHDAFDFGVEEFYDILGGFEPKDTSINGKNLIFVDACYFKSGVHYVPGDSEWTDTYYPYLDELDEKLANLQGDTYIFMHQNIDPTVPEDHCLHNAAQMREVLERHSCVKTVYQGHYHPGKNTLHNGIEYITLPAMCEKDEAYFLIDL